MLTVPDLGVPDAVHGCKEQRCVEIRLITGLLTGGAIVWLLYPALDECIAHQSGEAPPMQRWPQPAR
jgi:hypothetical protein